MKKYLFLGILFILILVPSLALADNVQTGNATVQNSVTNTVNGSNCATHIEVTINGQKEVLDSNDCGTHTLNSTANGTKEEPSSAPSITRSVFDSPTIIISKTPTSTPVPTISDKNRLYAPSLISVVVKSFEDLVKRIFRVF